MLAATSLFHSVGPIAFNALEYKFLYPDVPGNPADAAEHYVLHGRKEGRYASLEDLGVDQLILDGSGIFDRRFYRERTGLRGTSDPLRHYLLHGWRTVEPGPDFHGAFLRPYYATLGCFGPPAVTYAMLRSAGWPVYASQDRVESLADIVRVSTLFDARQYGASAPALGDHLDPASHYLLVGERMGIAPSAGFDPVYYGQRYPDVVEAQVNLLLHYLVSGKADRRSPAPPFPRSTSGPFFDPKKETVLIVSPQAARTEETTLALNIAQHLKNTYNIITALAGEGDLIGAFQAISAKTLAFGPDLSDPVDLAHALSMALRNHKIKYAIVNSIASRLFVEPLSASFVAVVLLMHEFSADSRPRDDVAEALGWATEVIFPAHLVADSARRDIPFLLDRDLRVIPPGQSLIPDQEGRAGDPGSDGLLRQMRPSPEDASFVVLGAGNVEFKKGVDIFLSVAAATLTQNMARPVRFVWVGDGYDPERDVHYSAYLAEQIRRSNLSDSVVLARSIPDLRGAFSAADVFFVSSRLDPLTGVSIDAALHGLPVLCFEEASGMAELLKQEPGTSSSVVPHLDVQAAAEFLVTLARDEPKRRTLGASTRALAQGLLDRRGYVERLDAIGTGLRGRFDQRQKDYDVIVADPLFDDSFYLGPYDMSLNREAAIKRFLGWNSQSWTSSRPKAHTAGLRRPCPGFHPQIYGLHHPDLAQTGANAFAEFIRKGRPQGPWFREVIRPLAIAEEVSGARLRAGLHAHFYYPELIGDFLRKLGLNRARCDLLMSTDTPDKARALEAATGSYTGGEVTIRVVPNRGRDIGPFLTAFRDSMLGYDVVGHLHGKRSIGIEGEFGDVWREFLWQHLLGGLFPMADAILTAFASNSNLGLVFAEDPHVSDWDDNRQIASCLAARAGIEPSSLEPFFDFPNGTMFWARSRALAPLLGLELDWADYPEEPLPEDGTILHALERLLPFSAATMGLSFATTHVPGVNR